MVRLKFSFLENMLFSFIRKTTKAKKTFYEALLMLPENLKIISDIEIKRRKCYIIF